MKLTWPKWFDRYSQITVALFNEIAATTAVFSALIVMFCVGFTKGGNFFILAWLAISSVFIGLVLIRMVIIRVGSIVDEKIESRKQLIATVVIIIALSIVPTVSAAILIVTTYHSAISR